MKSQMIRNSKLAAISLALAVSFGVGYQAANAEVVYRPMVIVEDAAQKRISIYRRTVKTSDGVTRTTKTTTTETTR